MPCAVFGVESSGRLVRLLVPLPPRRIEQLLIEAFGRALLAGRRPLEGRDVPAAKAPVEVPAPKMAPIVINAYSDELDEYRDRTFH